MFSHHLYSTFQIKKKTLFKLLGTGHCLNKLYVCFCSSVLQTKLSKVLIMQSHLKTFQLYCQKDFIQTCIIFLLDYCYSMLSRCFSRHIIYFCYNHSDCPVLIPLKQEKSYVCVCVVRNFYNNTAGTEMKNIRHKGLHLLDREMSPKCLSGLAVQWTLTGKCLNHYYLLISLTLHQN